MSLKSEIKVIMFDAGGILFTAGIPRDERIKAILRSMRLNKDIIDSALKKGNEFFSVFNESGRWINNWDEEKELFLNYYSVIAKEINVSDVYLSEKLFYLTHYANHCTLYPEVIDVLDSISKHYKLGVISNAYPSLDWIFDKLDIRKYFDTIIISAFIGKAKPEKSIYEKALEKINSEASECLFIDNKIINVEAAKAIGMKGIHIDREKNESLNIVKEKLIFI
ncbi:HAD-IA family hydrolase [candidate division WOR-3 bacterium]|nr:HAD-IA family hydrolase [candidate division WOR-3 bacterium]